MCQWWQFKNEKKHFISCIYKVYMIVKYYNTSAKVNRLVSLEHRRSHKQHSYICSNRQQYIVL